MKVYVVMSCPMHEPTTITGVFESGEDANRALAGYHESWNLEVQVHEIVPRSTSVPPEPK